MQAAQVYCCHLSYVAARAERNLSSAGTGHVSACQGIMTVMHSSRDLHSCLQLTWLIWYSCLVLLHPVLIEHCSTLEDPMQRRLLDMFADLCKAFRIDM